MLQYFPTPYPDELWYSVLCRYHVRSGNLKNATTIGELFHKKNHAAMGSLFPNNAVHEICQQLPKNVFSIENIVVNHMLFPYFLRIYPYDKKMEILHSIEIGNGPTLTHLWKMSAKTLPELRFCPICMEEDKKEYGEPYWHTEHQIPLVKVCRKHKCRLINCVFRRKGQLNESFVLPNDVKTDSMIDYHIEEQEKILAAYSYEYQYLPLEIGPTEGHNNLFQELLNQGYGDIKRRVNITINTEKLYRDLGQYYGESFVREAFGDNPKGFIFLRMKNWNLLSPERYIIVAAFLGQESQITFSKQQIENNLLKRIKELQMEGVVYSKKFVAEQIGVKTYQLDKVAEDLNINPFWLQSQKIEVAKTKEAKVFLTDSEKSKIARYIKENNFPNISQFIRYCIKKEMGDYLE